MKTLIGLALILGVFVGCAHNGLKSYHERGLASWYGAKFKGHKTSSGQVFDPAQMTAAHPSLPFGTRLRVKSLSTGRAVEVRVNDRGPYAHDRILDLSYAAAKALGIVQKGADEVDVDIIN